MVGGKGVRLIKAISEPCKDVQSNVISIMQVIQFLKEKRYVTPEWPATKLSFTTILTC